MNGQSDALYARLRGLPRVAFDLDGTLYDTRDFERPALDEVAQCLRNRSGKALPGIETMMQTRREYDRDKPGLFDDVLAEFELPREWVAGCVRIFRDNPATQLSGAPTLEPILNRLRNEGSRLALVSNGRPALQRRKLEQTGLLGQFDICVICDPDFPEQLKPSCWAWDQLAEWKGGHQVTYVGDTSTDEKFANCGNAGFVHFNFRNPVYGN